MNIELDQDHNVTIISSIVTAVFRSPEEVLEPVEDLLPDAELGHMLPHRLPLRLLKVLDTLQTFLGLHGHLQDSGYHQKI